MTLGGWMMLIMAVTLVGSLMTFCFYTILTETKHNHPASTRFVFEKPGKP